MIFKVMIFIFKSQVLRKENISFFFPLSYFKHLVLYTKRQITEHEFITKTSISQSVVCISETSRVCHKNAGYGALH